VRGLTHFDEAPSTRLTVGHLDATWTLLGEAAGSIAIGVRRIVVEPGKWATPVHDHGVEEEIFYVLAGRGISYFRDAAAPIRAGDCIVYLAGRGAHSVQALDEPLDVLAFGPRSPDNAPSFPRLGGSLLRGRFVESRGADAPPLPVQFELEAQLGPPDVSGVGERPQTIVNLDDVEPIVVKRPPRFDRVRRRISAEAGSVSTGLQHAVLEPGTESGPQHCHSLEEELFVVLDGDGVLLLGDDEVPVRGGSVVSRPAGTGVAHSFRAGDRGLTYLAYGPRDPGDVCYYPRSDKIAFRGVGVIARLERLDYWDGED
jgi:uncharacterized cupin superfamily protein